MDAGRECRRRKKQRQYFGEGQARVGYANQNFFGRCETIAHNNSRSGTGLGAGKIRLVLGERQVAGAATVGGRKTGQFNCAVSDDFRAQMARYFSGGKSHTSPKSKDSNV